MIELSVEQRSEAWSTARCGIPTSSGFDKIVTTSGEPSKQAQKYLYQLAGERIAGVKEETYQSKAMERGVMMESEAREFYELLTNTTVKTAGICYLNEEKLFSCSPDGFVGKNGLLEIKCPQMATHVSYLLADDMPSDYWQQVQGQLFITGRAWCDFMSYYPGLKPLIKRIKPNAPFIKKLEEALNKFCIELKEVEQKIK